MTLDPEAGADQAAESLERSGAASPGPVAPAFAAHQRSSGTARIAFRRRGSDTVLDRLHQEGCAKVRLPRGTGAVPEAVLINTAGGLTGGDRLAAAIACAEGARAVATTQACERIYRSIGGDAKVRATVTLAPGSGLAWLPQETILFDRSRLSRRFEVEMAEDAALVALEAVIFGRSARGETVRQGFLHDRWRIRRGGRLVLADDIRLDGPVEDLLARKAALAGNGAMATLLLCAPDCEQKLDAVRLAIGEAGGASAWNGKLLARLAAADGFALRQTLIPALAVLTGGHPLPKVWQL